VLKASGKADRETLAVVHSAFNFLVAKIWADTMEASAFDSTAMLKASVKADQEALASVHSAFP